VAESDGAQPEPEPESCISTSAADQATPGKAIEKTVDKETDKETAAVAAVAAAARQQLDERGMVAAKVMDEERGMGLVTRDELQGLLQRCAANNAVSLSLDRDVSATQCGAGSGSWKEWEELLLALPPEQEVEQPATQQSPEFAELARSAKAKKKKKKK